MPKRTEGPSFRTIEGPSTFQVDNSRSNSAFTWRISTW